MEITKELVERIADLARLTPSEDEKVRMCTQLEDILGSMTSLETLRLEEDLPDGDGVDDLRPDEMKQGGEER